MFVECALLQIWAGAQRCLSSIVISSAIDGCSLFGKSSVSSLYWFVNYLQQLSIWLTITKSIAVSQKYNNSVYD